VRWVRTPRILRLGKAEDLGPWRLSLDEAQEVRGGAAAEEGTFAAGVDRGQVNGLHAGGGMTYAIDATMHLQQETARQ
jgi:hypothetical protein